MCFPQVIVVSPQFVKYFWMDQPLSKYSRSLFLKTFHSLLNLLLWFRTDCTTWGNKFFHFCCFPTEQIAQNVREEIHRLRRRKMLRSSERSMEYEGGYESPVSPPSPACPASPSLSPSPSPAPSSSSGLAALHQHHHHQSSLSKDKPLFTFRQVRLLPW